MTNKRQASDKSRYFSKALVDEIVWHFDVSSSHLGTEERFGCSPIKMVGKLDLKRCETVLFLSATNVENREDYIIVRET